MTSPVPPAGDPSRGPRPRAPRARGPAVARRAGARYTRCGPPAEPRLGLLVGVPRQDRSGSGTRPPGKDAWINGGSPTKGFLAFGTSGPFKGIYQDIAGKHGPTGCSCSACSASGSRWSLGVTMRLAAAAGALLLVLMWTAVLPPENNLFMDDHLIYALVLVLLAAVGAGKTLGLGSAWERMPFVSRNDWLK